MQKYQNQRFYAVYPVTAILLCVSIFGLFGNCNIIWATIRKRFVDFLEEEKILVKMNIVKLQNF